MQLLTISISVIGIAAFVEISLRLAVRSSFGRRLTEFPASKYEDLEKFINYDDVLGWEAKPNGRQLDSGHTSFSGAKKAKASYSIAQDGSRKQSVPSIALRGPFIETFGDSTCFCRGVNNDETFQYYLERDHQVGPVKNYGVGNYGLDQAYLRARRRMVGGGDRDYAHADELSLSRGLCIQALRRTR